MKVNNEMDWYVVYTYPNSEKKVFNELSKIGIEAYLPLYKITRQWSDRKKKVEVPLFRNYLFTRLEKKFCWKVLSVNGVVKFLATDKNMAVVTNTEIEIIKKLVTSEFNCITIGQYNRNLIGESVIIENGLMSGVEGKIIDINNKRNVLIELPTINQTIVIDLSKNDIRIIKNLHLN